MADYIEVKLDEENGNEECWDAMQERFPKFFQSLLRQRWRRDRPTVVGSTSRPCPASTMGRSTPRRCWSTAVRKATCGTTSRTNAFRCSTNSPDLDPSPGRHGAAPIHPPHSRNPTDGRPAVHEDRSQGAGTPGRDRQRSIRGSGPGRPAHPRPRSPQCSRASYREGLSICGVDCHKLGHPDRRSPRPPGARAGGGRLADQAGRRL